MDPVRQLVQQRPGFFAADIASQPEATRINDFIYMSSGMSNSYMLTTPAGRIIINTGMGFEAPVHKRNFDAVHEGPTPFILLTQGHVDHVGGVRLFREAGTQVIAQQNNAACQRDDERIRVVRSRQANIWFEKTLSAAARLAASQPERFRQDVPTPDVLFDDRHALHLGGLDIELLATPGGETIDSCVIWLPQHRILFTGNMLGPLFPHFPNFNTIRGDRYRHAEPYLESVRRIRALQPELLITGHFEPIFGRDLIGQCLDRLHAAVSHVHEETLRGMNAGVDIWTLMREVQLPEELYVGQGYGKVSWAVRTFWETYMGWFKAEHTSELYPTQPADIYAELVELAGINAVVARGRMRLEQENDPEGANLLAEAALAADPQHAGALQLCLDAHRRLLTRSGEDNFWEVGWLRNRIGKLEQALSM